MNNATAKGTNTMSNNTKLFNVAGTSVLNGVLTYRFATGSVARRFNVLNNNGHTDIKLRTLPYSMTQMDAIAHLASQGIVAVLPGRSKANAAAAERVVINCELDALIAAADAFVAPASLQECNAELDALLEELGCNNEPTAEEKAAAKREAANARKRAQRAAAKAAA